MKIGFVLDDTLDKPDGVQQYVLSLGSWLKKQGHDVHYLVGQTRRSDIDNVHSLSRNIHVTFNGNRMSVPLPSNKKAIRTLLETEEYDVLHIQTPYSPFLGGRIILQAAPYTVVVSTFHILPYSWKERWATRILGAYVWRSKRRIDVSLGTSRPASQFAQKAYGLPTRPVPNMVAVKEFSHARPLYPVDGVLRIVFLGRLVERKGCLYLLKAVKQLHQKKLLTTTRVVICGKGELETQAKQYVRDHHLSAIVHFEGFVSEQDKPRILASADIAVFPSDGGESFGIVLIEAMAAGARVVLGGDNPGYASVLGVKPAQLVDPKDTSAFAATLAHYIKNSHARTAAHKWQQKHVQQYDVAVVGATLLTIYEQAIAKRRASSHNEA